MVKSKKEKTAPRAKLITKEKLDNKLVPGEKKIIEHYRSNDTNNFKRWWAVEDKDKLYDTVNQTVNTIEASQTPLRMTFLKYCRMYGNYQALGFSNMNNDFNSFGGQSSGRKCVYNVVQSCIDTACSKIAKDQPRITFVTNGAKKFTNKVKARKLTKLVNALMKSSGVYKNSEQVFRDAAVLGNGYLKFYLEDGEIKTELVSAHEIVVDYADGMKEAPRSMHQIKFVARDMLMVAYRDDAEKCRKIQSASSALHGKMQTNAVVDMIEVIESWHLPSNSKADDGMHCITIDNCTLMQEEYTKDYFPIVCWRWMPMSLTYYGRSIAEELADKQMEITAIMSQIKQSIELVGVPIVMVPNEAKIARDDIASNYIGRVIKYQGNQPPTFMTPTAQNGEVYEYLKWLISSCYQQTGISEQSAAGQKPQGVDSAVAMRAVSDIEAGRFAMVALRWEQLFVEFAKVVIDLCRDAAKDDPEFIIKYSEDKSLHEVKFLDVDLDNKDCEIFSAFPTSQLPDQPAGRIQTISEYIQNGWLTKERAMELLNLDADLESEVDLQTAPLRIIEQWLSDMIDDGTYHHPEPLMNCQLAQTIAQGTYNQLLIDRCPEDKLQLVRRFITECQAINVPPAPPTPPQAAPAAPGPQGSQGMAPQPNPNQQMVPMSQ